ncbi:MAG: shikimate dehydrogenase [Caldimicrobium sp.]|nr:shikimate dehydrogenase [Caldimicrobium sp.]MCX7613013.1 shikimate dehydrogenase [Caldimicrobium sp.]MDW8182284.1 shikimate dehydrogenase [Caldimicrobium sp.]
MYRVFGIIGDPVSHSLSPVMHNEAFRSLGFKAVYGAFWVRREELSQAVEALKVLKIQGLSVTIPHKEEIMKYLHEVDEVSRAIGAVNTILNKENTLLGLNTDWIGVKRAFEERNISLKGKRVAILGAGGASRAVIYALKREGASDIILYNRTWDKAKELADRFEIDAQPWESLNRAYGDIIIQTTSVGLKSKETPVDEKVLRNFEIAMDIVYLPLKTMFIYLAERMGLTTIDGLRMLLHQGVEQFKLFTGYDAPFKIMEKVIYEEAKKLEREFYLGHKDS